MWRLRTIATRIVLAVLGILLATVAIGGALDVQLTKRTFDRQYQDRARAVANVVAQIPQVRAAVAAGDPDRIIPALAERIASGSDASYVVVTDRSGLRYSHPTPALIGQRLEEPVAVLDGKDHVGIDHGSLGRSANGKAPIFDAAGTVIGQVSVGIVERRVSAAVNQQIAAIAMYSAIALAVGALVAIAMGRTLRRATFGLEPAEIGSLLQDREAMLHGIREGVIGLDTRQRITLINDEARRLLHLTGTVLGSTAEEVFPPGRLQDVLSGASSGPDQEVLSDEALLVVNRNPVIVGGRDVGSVITLRDRTELESLVRELHAMTGLANALRAQEHEFTNRLHVIAGLIELEEFDEAVRFATAVSQGNLTSAEDLRARVAPPVVAALLLAKLTVAAEREIDFAVTPSSHLEVPDRNAQDVMTIIGNLIDNAMDAVAAQPPPRTVRVDIDDTSGVRIVVSDNGPGIAPETLDQIFLDGYSTKAPRRQSRRGLGLALVQRLVHRAGGTVTVHCDGGARFEVRLPSPAVADCAIPPAALHAR